MSQSTVAIGASGAVILGGTVPKLNKAFIAKLRLIDDLFMSCCFDGNVKCVELVLRITLDMPELKVLSVKTQYELKNLRGRSIRLDIWATDGTRQFGVEIQRDNGGAIARRARYDSSLMDANFTPRGAKNNELPNHYFIMITENDVLGKGLPVYHIDRIIRETGESFGDGSHIVYVNGACRDDTPLGHLMHDFFCTDAKDMYYDEIAECVRYHKESEESVSKMGSVIEMFEKRAAEKAAKEAAYAERVELAKKALARGKLTDEEIAEDFGLSLHEVKALAGEKSA